MALWFDCENRGMLTSFRYFLCTSGNFVVMVVLQERPPKSVGFITWKLLRWPEKRRCGYILLAVILDRDQASPLNFSGWKYYLYYGSFTKYELPGTCRLLSPSHRWSCRIYHLMPGNIHQRRSTEYFLGPRGRSVRNHHSCSHRALE